MVALALNAYSFPISELCISRQCHLASSKVGRYEPGTLEQPYRCLSCVVYSYHSHDMGGFASQHWTMNGLIESNFEPKHHYARIRWIGFHGNAAAPCTATELVLSLALPISK